MCIVKNQKLGFEMEIPDLSDFRGNEDEVNDKLDFENGKLYNALEQFLTTSLEQGKISSNQKEILLGKLEKMDFYSGEFIITDDELYDKLNKKYMKKSKKYFKLMADLASTGSSEYMIEYTLQSEFYQWFHEDPDKRRKRVDGPIEKKLKKLDKKMEKLDREIDLYCYNRIIPTARIMQERVQNFVDDIEIEQE